ncbi:MAG: DUF3284 domain-containing protein [Erysipelotrichaceae bacterium]
MKIDKNIKNITVDEFFSALEQGFIQRYQESTKKKITADKIKTGLSFTQNPDNKYTKQKITIVNYQHGKIYHEKIDSLFDNQETIYTVKAIQKGINVELEQNNESIEKKKNVISRNWAKALIYGRMSDSIFKIVNYAYKVQEEKS